MDNLLGRTDRTATEEEKLSTADLAGASHEERHGEMEGTAVEVIKVANEPAEDRGPDLSRSPLPARATGPASMVSPSGTSAAELRPRANAFAPTKIRVRCFPAMKPRGCASSGTRFRSVLWMSRANRWKKRIAWWPRR